MWKISNFLKSDWKFLNTWEIKFDLAAYSFYRKRNDKVNWMNDVKFINDDFKGKIWCSHGKSNFCGVLITLYLDEKVNVKKV